MSEQSDSKVPQAERIKLVREGETADGSAVKASGAKPIRKKGFYRAWRRRELWAIVSYQNSIMEEAMKKMRDNFAKVLYSPYCSNDTIYVMWPLSKILKEFNE